MSAVDLLHPVVTHHIVNTLQWPSLRSLQEEAVMPLLAGEDALLIAPTAGGKTEAAVFPLLSAMASDSWSGLSVLYVCPLRALLNNLESRIAGYASWVGRKAGLWHGDTSYPDRQRLIADPPDLLLTTPESLESMLISTRVDPHTWFAGLRAVVIDELHAFAGDDRGWHLLAVLDRLERITARPLQRIGLSATVGNPAEMLSWLQGGNPSRPGRLVTPPEDVAGRGSGGSHEDRVVAGTDDLGRLSADVTLDYVGSLSNAATVISSLHTGEKRLVFCETRRQVEELSYELRQRDVTTFVSHSSVALDERRRAEQAFAEARDCVIVSTSTLELGIDVGDLDRVIQIDAPRTVTSFLQRLGRTGRRAGASRNALLLAVKPDTLVNAAGLLKLWSEGWVEPVTPPPSPRHLVAQQLLGLCLQENQVGLSTWPDWLPSLGAIPDSERRQIMGWLLETGHLESDSGLLFIGPEAERRYGSKHFLDLVSVFTAEPEFTVMTGRQQIGSVDSLVLTSKIDGARIVVLAGRSWEITHIDWKRRRCWAVEVDKPGTSRWQNQAQPMSYEMCQARRDVLLGDSPGVRLTERAVAALADACESSAHTVARDRTVVDTSGPWWWTWAGARANATLAAALPDVVDPRTRYDNDRLRLKPNVEAGALHTSVETTLPKPLPPPEPDPAAIRGLKFAESLPPDLAVRTLADRLADRSSALTILGSRHTRLGPLHSSEA